MTQRGRLLVGMKEICEYCGFEKATFYSMIQAGMPARAHTGRWMANTDNLDDFFRRFTAFDNRKSMQIPEAE